MGKMCLFSAVRGVVLDHGKPVEGARIEQSWEWVWNGKKGGDSAVTDQQGAFALSSVWRGSLTASLLPHEPIVVQTILIHFAGKSYKGWMLDKHSYRENGELEGRPIQLICNLEAELTHHGKMYGICEPNSLLRQTSCRPDGIHSGHSVMLHAESTLTPKADMRREIR